MKSEIKNYRSYHNSKGIAFGIILVIMGALLLGLNFGLINAALKPVFFSWPILFILLGISQLVHRNYFSSLVSFSVGIFFLLPKVALAYPKLFPGIGTNFLGVYWPVLLILIGIFILLHIMFPNKWHKEWRKYGHSHWKNSDNSEYFTYHKQSGTGGSFDKNIVFGGVEQIFLDEIFPGGEINTVFGGIKLDLRKTHLAEGDTYLDINAVFGGVTLYIPSDWLVVTKFDNFAGGFVDKRVPEISADKSKRLIITGSCVFGGGEIL